MIGSGQAAPGSARRLLHADLCLPSAASEVIADAAVLLEDGAIAAVGPYQAVRRSYPLAQQERLKGRLLLPGFIDAHTHGRGLPMLECGITDAPLEAFLLRFLALPPVDPYDSTLVAAAGALRSGVTSLQLLFHTFEEPSGYRRSLGRTLAALRAAGISADVALGITDEHEYVPAWAESLVPSSLRADLLDVPRGMSGGEWLGIVDELAERGFGTDGLAENRPMTGTVPGTTKEAGGGPNAADPLAAGARGFADGALSAGPQIRPQLGPVAPQWCSPDLLKEIAVRARGGLRVHTHVLEVSSQRTALADRGSPVNRLLAAGLVGPWLSAAHGVWMDGEGLQQFVRAGAQLVHCAGSNLRLSDGTAPVQRWRAAGLAVGIGLDSHSAGAPHDMFDELRQVRRTAAAAGSPLTSRQVLEMATVGGAAALGLSAVAGTLEPGTRADVTGISFNLWDTSPQGDIVEDLVALGQPADVTDVWVGGSRRVKGGTVAARSELAAARRRLSNAVANHAEEVQRGLRRIVPAERWLLRLLRDEA